MTSDSPRLRLGIVGVVVLSLFAALLARAYYLQVLAAPEYKLLARSNTVRTVYEPAPRGQIKDRNGVVLVGNRASNVVAVDRAIVPDATQQKRLLERLSEVLRVAPDVLEQRLHSSTASPYTPVPVADDVDERAMIELRERQDEFVGVVARQVAVRDYPFGDLAAHVLGYVGEIFENEMKAHPNEYRLGDSIGKSGVEESYEKQLRGTPGVLKIEVDAAGKPVRVVSHKPPVQGSDLILSIDVGLQQVAEQSLREGLAAAHRQVFQDDKKLLKADAGAAVVLDTKEGTVLAMASWPTFDLPAVADGVSQQEYETFFQSKLAPFTNRAISGHYAPGSTWKLVTADAALRSGLITPNYTIDDNGIFISEDCPEDRPECRRRNAGTKAWGPVDVRRALAVSSDVFFYKLGDRFWTEWKRNKKYGETAIQDVGRLLGFGEATGVPLAGESPGRVPTRELRAQLHDKNPVGFPTREWYQGDNVSLAIGQGELDVTPIQVANAYGTYANGGTRFDPNLVLRVEKQDGTLISAIPPRKTQVELPPVVRSTILQGLTGVLTDKDGTAKNAFAGFPLDRFSIAGKTGTAQRPPKQDDAWFVGIGPMRDPQYSVAVLMEQSGFGAQSAAPVAKRIFAKLAGVDEAGPVSVASGARD
jgi:penicillin-binding protein 2